MVVDSARGLGHPSADRRCHDVAGSEVVQRVDALHHPLASAVVQDRALAAHGLAHQRLLARGVGPAPQHGRVELHELDVASPAARRAGPCATPSPVTAGGFDVDANTWPVAAGGEHDGRGP